MARRMKQAMFREETFRRRYEGDVESVNRFVDELRVTHGEGNVPYVDPDCGGVNAQVLFLYQDPGPKASGPSNASGFLSLENDDPSADNLYHLLQEADLPWKVCVPWNAVPWYINRAGRAHELIEALPSLHRVRGLLPRLSEVALMGNSAQSAWRQYARHYPSDVADIEASPSCHTSVRGLTAGSRRTMAEGKAEVLGVLREIRSRVEL